MNEAHQFSSSTLTWTLCFYLSYWHCCYTLNCMFMLFSHNVSSYISTCHSAENPDVLKPSCVSSFETHSHVNKPDSTLCLFIVPRIKHTCTIQYKTVTRCFPRLVLSVPPRVVITGLLMIFIATAHA